MPDTPPKPTANLDPVEFLLECVANRDITKWNSWRERENRHIHKADLRGVGGRLAGQQLHSCDLRNVDLSGVDLSRASLVGAKLGGAILAGACLVETDLSNVSAVNANFHRVKCDHAIFVGAQLCGSNLREACGHGCQFMRADFHDLHAIFPAGGGFTCPPAALNGSHFEDTEFCNADLRGVEMDTSTFKKCRFDWAIVDGQTSFRSVQIDRWTSFLGVGVPNARSESAFVAQVQYNLRRASWEARYAEGPLVQRFTRNAIVRPFWAMSDYGRSTVRVLATFAVLAAAFALLYFIAACISPPGLVDGLLPHAGGGFDGVTLGNAPIILTRSLYFSVVTMTTLGFGDMYARASSILSHVLLIAQVLLGYVMLGALVTRFSVLFACSGDA